MSFAKRFEEARERAGLSVASLSKRLGVSPQSVYLWQQGSVPKAARLRELADLLGVSLQWLVYGNEEPHSVMDYQNGVVVVPQLNIEPSAGFGGFVDSESDWPFDGVAKSNPSRSQQTIACRPFSIRRFDAAHAQRS